MPCQKIVIAALAGLFVVARWTGTAGAIPGSGPHETVDITLTTTQPNTSTGLNWSATFRDPASPTADPPALRKLVIVGPRGTRSDTSVVPQCNASDAQLRQQGAAACPPGSQIGSGTATVKMLAVPKTWDTTLFNDHNGQFELVNFPVGSGGVIRSWFHGRVDVGNVPTCLMGGDPPQGCAADQIVLLSNRLHQDAKTTGRGRHRHNLLTTPRYCPRSGSWSTHVTFYYGDGTVETAVTREPCTHAHRQRHRR